MIISVTVPIMFCRTLTRRRVETTFSWSNFGWKWIWISDLASLSINDQSMRTPAALSLHFLIWWLWMLAVVSMNRHVVGDSSYIGSWPHTMHVLILMSEEIELLTCFIGNLFKNFVSPASGINFRSSTFYNCCLHS